MTENAETQSKQNIVCYRVTFQPLIYYTPVSSLLTLIKFAVNRHRLNSTKTLENEPWKTCVSETSCLGNETDVIRVSSHSKRHKVARHRMSHCVRSIPRLHASVSLFRHPSDGFK